MAHLPLRSRAALFGLAALLAVSSRVDAGPVTIFNASVNEWSSSTPSNPGAGIYPIGGTGQVNGGFVVTTAMDGDQIGLRAELRFGGPVLPQTNDGLLTATYLAPPGSSGGSLAKWNFDADIDLRRTGHTISDYTATLTFTDRGGLVSSENLVTSGFVPSNAVLYQNSENPGFSFLAPVFPAFDPNASGTYSFDLKLVPSFVGDTLEAKMNVEVTPEPASLILFGGMGAVGLVGYAWRRRRSKPM
jgi:PEP-CTERM motif